MDANRPGWGMWRRSAPAVNVPQSAIATKCLSWRASIHNLYLWCWTDYLYWTGDDRPLAV